MARKQFLSYTLVLLLFTFTFSIVPTVPNLNAKPEVKSNGIPWDWPFAFKAADPLNDTQEWSWNETAFMPEMAPNYSAPVLRYGETAEWDNNTWDWIPGAPFDAARDLVALNITYNNDTIWFRLYVRDLVDNDSLRLGALYQIQIDMIPWAGMNDVQNDGRTYINGTSALGGEGGWDRSILIMMTNSSQSPSTPVLSATMVGKPGFWDPADDTNSTPHQVQRGGSPVTIVGNMTVEANFVEDYVEVSAPWDDLEYLKMPEMIYVIPDEMQVVALSFKPGQWDPRGWRVVFDPGAPGTTGIEWQATGNKTANPDLPYGPMWGPDAADVMPGDKREIDWTCGTWPNFTTEWTGGVYYNFTGNVVGQWYNFPIYLEFPAAWDPTAQFTHSPTVPKPGEITTFDASASKPGWNGSAWAPIVSYAWDWGDTTSNITTSPVINHTYTEEGNYEVTLNVTDTRGRWNTITKTVYVSWEITKPPHGPTARFTNSPTVPKPGEITTFDASASKPGWNGTHDMPIVTYSWNFDGNVTELPTPLINHTYMEEGLYNVTLNVTDAQGWWDTINKTIKVSIPTIVYALNATDPLNDTQSWSTNITLVSMCNTSEAGLPGAPFDAARDLTGFLVYFNLTHVFFRVYVRDLVSNDSLALGALYLISIDLIPETGQPEAQLNARTYGDPTIAWERNIGIKMMRGTLPDTIGDPLRAWLKDQAWGQVDDTPGPRADVGNMRISYNLTENYVETIAPWEDFYIGGKMPEHMNVVVMSIKPGMWDDPTTENFRRAFDPQGVLHGQCDLGEEWANNMTAGPDAADVMPGNATEIDWTWSNATADMVGEIVPENSIAGWYSFDIVFPVKDEEAPVIHSVRISPEEPTVKDRVTVVANITDNIGVTSAYINYTSDGIYWRKARLRLVNATLSPNNYTGKIPKQAVAGTIVNFTIVALDAAENIARWNYMNYTVKPTPRRPISGLITAFLVIAIIGAGVIAVGYFFVGRKPKPP